VAIYTGHLTEAQTEPTKKNIVKWLEDRGYDGELLYAAFGKIALMSYKRTNSSVLGACIVQLAEKEW